jgi:hypothetical protein
LLDGPDGFSGLDFGSGTNDLFFTRATDNYRNIHRVNSDGTGLTQITTFGSGFIREIDHFASSANKPPAADAGTDRTYEATSSAGASVQLDGTGSSDPDPSDVLTFTWVGPFGTATGPAPTVTLPLGTHTIMLTVDDGRGGVASDTVQITVVDTTAPVVTPPGAITIPATEAGGTRAGSWVALADFLAGGSAADLVDPNPLRLAAQVNGADADNSTLFPLGTTTVTFRFRDASGNIGMAASSVTVQLGTPRISGAIVGKGRTPDGLYYMDVRFTNTGTGNARNVQINTLAFRTLSGAGSVTCATDICGGLPLAIGNLNAGGSTIVKFYLRVPETVTRFSITETGSLQNVAGAASSFSMAQSVFP